MPRATPAVTFDLWHTLVYLEPSPEDAYNRQQVDAAVHVLEKSAVLPGAPEVSRDELRTLFEREFSAAVTEADAGRSVTPGTQLTRAARAAGRVARPEAYVDALERLVGGTPFRTAPYAIAVLQELRASGCAVGVISNTVGELGRFLRPILTRFGFDRYVEVYTFSDEHPWAKPAPEIFRSTLDALGSDPTVAVHVGDGWADIEGPRRAGMRGAILYTGLQEYGGRYRELNLPQGREVPAADHRVSSLPDVVPLVHRMLRPAPGDRSARRG